MTASEFKDKWQNLVDTDLTPLVGIVVDWNCITSDAKVINYYGKGAWQKIYDFTPPWYEKENRRPFKEFTGTSNYLKEICMEKEKQTFNKFEFIREHGLKNPLTPLFLAFSDISGKQGVLGDGCHRFLVADFLIREEKLNLDEDINKTQLDVICLKNFEDVIPFDPFN